MTAPYAFWQAQHDRDVAREARLTITALNAGRQLEDEAMQAILQPDAGDGDEPVHLDGFDDLPDWIQDGDD